VGKEGYGCKYAIEVLNEGRIGIEVSMGSFDKAIAYCLNDRKQFGKAMANFKEYSFNSRKKLRRMKLLGYSCITQHG
jgi:alkylation response protein AidB-like acyl-CoA dehydrogenase